MQAHGGSVEGQIIAQARSHVGTAPGMVSLPVQRGQHVFVWTPSTGSASPTLLLPLARPLATAQRVPWVHTHSVAAPMVPAQHRPARTHNGPSAGSALIVTATVSTSGRASRVLQLTVTKMHRTPQLCHPHLHLQSTTSQ